MSTQELPAGFEKLARFQGDPEEPTASDFLTEVVAPGSDALLSLGVIFQAGWQIQGDGLARHARATARALSKSGLPVVLAPLPISRVMMDDEIEESVKREVGYLRSTSIATAPLAIRHIILHNEHYVENVLSPLASRFMKFEDQLKVYHSTILYTSWERTTIHPEIVAVLNRCAGVWVPCDMNRKVFERAGVQNVTVIPCAWDPETSPTAWIPAPRGSEDVPLGKRFYAIGKWEPRKNYHALLGAFLLEFSPNERASLLIKTSEWGAWKDYPTGEESLRHWLSTPEVQAKGWTPKQVARLVRIITKKLPDDEITAIHRQNNIYVTCSHGEAWDLPAFDARLAGNTLVYTGWGGAEDYARASDVEICGDVMPFEPVHSGYGWEADADWASVSVAEIRAALRTAEPPARRVLDPKLGRDFGTAAVGQQMLKAIEDVLGVEKIGDLLEQGGFW